MKKRFGCFLVCCMLLLTQGTWMVFASQTENVFDEAGLLTEDETVSVESALKQTKEETGWNIFAVTTADAGGKTATQYAEDFFDTQSGEQKDGVVLLIDMDNREIYVSTCGEAIRYLTDSRQEAILDDAYADVSNENYSDCFLTMLGGVQEYYKKGIPDNQYNYDTQTGAVSRYRTLTGMEILIAVAAALAAGAATFGVIVGRYRLKFGTYQYAFREFGKVQLDNSSDALVNTTMLHRRIPQNNGGAGNGGNSGGKSSTHMSSSGNTHGGSGRKF